MARRSLEAGVLVWRWLPRSALVVVILLVSNLDDMKKAEHICLSGFAFDDGQRYIGDSACKSPPGMKGKGRSFELELQFGRQKRGLASPEVEGWEARGVGILESDSFVPLSITTLFFSRQYTNGVNTDETLLRSTACLTLAF